MAAYFQDKAASVTVLGNGEPFAKVFGEEVGKAMRKVGVSMWWVCPCDGCVHVVWYIEHIHTHVQTCNHTCMHTYMYTHVDTWTYTHVHTKYTHLRYTIDTGIQYLWLYTQLAMYTPVH